MKVLFLAMSVFFVVGCGGGSDVPECTVDADCSNNYWCGDGHCHDPVTDPKDDHED